MIKKIFTTTILTVQLYFILCAMSPLQGDEGDTYWYVNGRKYYWHYQTDVYAFRKTNGEPWSGMLDTNCVRFIFHRGAHSDKMNVLYFKSACSQQDKEAIKESIRAGAGFEREFPAITLFPEQGYDGQAWFIIDDLLLVNFNQDSINQTTFNAFKQKYGLNQINFPDSIFPENITTTVFQTDITDAGASTIDLAKTIYSQDSGFVMNVQPNLIFAYENASDENINLLNAGANATDLSGLGYYLANNNIGNQMKLVVQFKSISAQAMVRVYDLFGREMANYEISGQKSQVDIPTTEYSSGIYFLAIENARGEALVVEKFLKI